MVRAQIFNGLHVLVVMPCAQADFSFEVGKKIDHCREMGQESKMRNPKQNCAVSCSQLSLGKQKMHAFPLLFNDENTITGPGIVKSQQQQNKQTKRKT